MKKCFFVLLIFLSAYSETLAVGEIAFTSYSPATGMDEFSFVTLVDIPGSLQINFTDSGWLGDNSGFRAGEGVITWIAPVAGSPAGTQIIINVETGSVVSGGGTSSETDAGFDLSASDQIIAYIVQNGTGNIFPIAALDYNAASTWDADATSASTSALPMGLTDGVTAIALTSSNDYGKYACSTNPTSGSQASLLSTINNSSNWTTSNSVLSPTVSPCTYTVSGSALSVDFISFSGKKKNISINLNWQTSSETNNQGFEVQKSRNAVSFETIARINGAGDSEDLNSYNFTDEQPFTGSNYYRLKQQDFDGSEEYSKIIQVYFEADGSFVSLYPNPLVGGQSLNIDKSESLQLNGIRNINGQSFQKTEELIQGLYFLQFTGANGESITKKLVVN